MLRLRMSEAKPQSTYAFMVCLGKTLIQNPQSKIFTPLQSNHYAINAFPFTVQNIFPQSLLIFKASRSHSGTLHLVGLLCTNDQPDEGNST
jgi:hypothetical protein